MILSLPDDEQQVYVMTATVLSSFNTASDPGVAGDRLLAVSVVEGECLLERKQMLGAVGAGERLSIVSALEWQR